MTERLFDRLQRKLGETFSNTWEHANAVDAVLDPLTEFSEQTEILRGGVSFRVKDSGGVWHVVHHEAMREIRTNDELDDWLARGLSRFLMKHPMWPK